MKRITLKLTTITFPLAMKRINLIMLILLIMSVTFESFSQTGAPCNAYRWKKGGNWIGNGCAVNDGNSAPNPRGIVRCANAADAESGVNVNTTYDPNVFKITLTPNGCENPNNNMPVTNIEPFTGQKISWFNFDVRPYAGIYDFQTIATGNYELEWALYYSTAATCGTSDQDPSANVVNLLSGDCSKLSGLLACGTGFTGWSPQPFVTPIFNKPTNIYLVVWKKGATNSSNDAFDYTFKARYGCGELCSLNKEGNPTITCNPNGSYTIVQNLSGSNTTVSVSATGSTSISTNPNPLTFTTADAIPNVNTGTVTVTYPAGVNYNITMTPSGTGSFCIPVSISGAAPNCCTPISINRVVTPISCNGGSNGAINITASGGTSPYNYDWADLVGTNNIEDRTALLAGTYTVTVTDANGCTGSTSATINAAPAAITLTALANQIICFGGKGSVTLSSNGATPLSYGGDATSNLSAGTYNYTVTDANGCMASTSATISQPKEPLSIKCSSTNVTCNGANTGTASVSGFSYNVGSVTYSIAPNIGTQNPQALWKFEGLPAGTYTITAQDDCTSSTCQVTIAPSKCAHLFPTSTSCCTYSNGTALELPEICYTAATNNAGGSISNATPGVFFYYAKFVATSTDFIVDVLQENDLSSFKLFNIQQSNQIIIWGPNCEKVATGIEIGTSGQGTVQVKKAIVGATYVISVKYDTKTIIGSNYSGLNKPEVKYTFKSQIKPANDPFAPYSDIVGSKGTILAKDCKSVFVSPGVCPPPVQPLMSNNKTNYSVFENKLSVIPNPANSIVELSFNAEMDSRSAIIISDMNGKTLRKIDYQAVVGLNTTSVNLDDLANGVYIITVKTNNQQLAERLVIMK